MRRTRRRRLPNYVVLLFASVLLTCSGCQLGGILLESFLRTEKSEFEKDIERRGPGSQEAWLNATGGTFNGNLPRE